MNADRWEQITRLFESASELAPAVRGVFLDGNCAGDPELRREVESLLEQIEVEDDPIESFVRQELLSFERYRLIRRIGEGGMGIVYEAEQYHPRRTVALKVLKPGLVDPETLHRFAQETEALARLEHPGIARIYDAGTSDNGFGRQPWFALEFIRGRPLLEYAEACALSTRERLELIARICDAVHHAHLHGIVHRDLKPANILVDENGQPKILDFGVARFLGTDNRLTRQTHFGELVGTLKYMSPEQVSGDHSSVDARSDVYSLGVVLYELLAGQLPYTVSPQIHEAARAIREDDPALLGSINRGYRGDIETIAGKALDKDRSRRYSSAEELADDLRSCLNNRPIRAVPPSLSYQARKLAARHKGLVASLVALFMVLTIGIVASTAEAVRAARAERNAIEARDRALRAEQDATSERNLAQDERNRARHERDLALMQTHRADTEAATAKAVRDFLRDDILAQAGAGAQAITAVKPDPDLKVRVALDRAAARIGGRFDSQPAVEASIRQTIGIAYRDLGVYDRAEEQLRKALEVDRKFRGPDDPVTLECQNELAVDLVEAGQYGAAEPLLSGVLEAQQRRGQNNGRISLVAMNELALLANIRADYPRSEELFEGVLKIQRRLLGNRDFETLAVMNNLAAAYTNSGKYARAEELYREAVEIKRQVLGPDHPSTLMSAGSLGVVYRYEGKLAQAEVQLQATLAARRRTRGNLHPDTLASMQSLALLYEAQSRYAEAESLLTEAYSAISQGAQEDPRIAVAMAANLTEIRLKRGSFHEAEALITEVFRNLDKSIGDGWRRYDFTSMLGACLAGQGRFEEAEPLALAGYRGLEEHRGSIPAGRRSAVDEARSRVAAMYQAWGKPKEAAEWNDSHPR